MIYEGVKLELERLLDRWAIDDVRKVGNELNGKCPWENHKSGGRKFYINAETGLWECKACSNRRGSILWLVQLMEGLTRDNAHVFLLDRGSEIDPDEFIDRISSILHDVGEPKHVRKKARKNALHALRVVQRSQRHYFGYWRDKRGLSQNSVNMWDLRFDPTDNTFVIPYTVENRLVSVVKRITPRSPRRLRELRMKYITQSGFQKSKYLFGLDKAESNHLVLTEGPLDCISVWNALDEHHMLDKFSPVAIMGNRVSAHQVKLIEQNADYVTTLFDNESSGQVGLLVRDKWDRYRLQYAESLNSFLIQEPKVRTYIGNYADSEAKDPGEMDVDEIIWSLLESHTIAELRMKEKNG